MQDHLRLPTAVWELTGLCEAFFVCWLTPRSARLLCSVHRGHRILCERISAAEWRQNGVARWDAIWTLNHDWGGGAFWSWSDYTTLTTQASSSCGGWQTGLTVTRGWCFYFHRISRKTPHFPTRETICGLKKALNVPKLVSYYMFGFLQLDAENSIRV